VSLAVAVAALVGAYAVPAHAYTSPGLQCAILKVWSEGAGHGGVPKYGVTVGLYDHRYRAVWMNATVLDGTGKQSTTPTLFVPAGSSRTATVTANSARVSITRCATP